MYFQIIKLILWPKSDKKPRIVEFQPGKVNVISGLSKTGKSAVIPIIDYCLGAKKCAIPVGVIRTNCSWFGVLIETVEGQKLICRKEPGSAQNTGDMFILEAPVVDIPDRIEAKNTNVDAIKAMLNRLAGLSSLQFEPDSDSGFKSRVSFRDLMAFNFQPQNIVANPDVLFFKADTTEHREKLKTIFPYVLQAVTPEVLQARAELEVLNRALRRRDAELRNLNSATRAWRLEIESWVRQAIEYGLLPDDYTVSDDWDETVQSLVDVTRSNSRKAAPQLSGIDVTIERLKHLRTVEADQARELSGYRKKMNELGRLLESSDAYGDAIKIQRDRLSLSSWLRDKIVPRPDPLVDLIGDSTSNIDALCDTLEGIEIRLKSQPRLSDTLDRETNRLRREAEGTLERLLEVRKEIVQLEKDSDVARESAHRSDRIERFLGRVEQALSVYKAADASSDLNAEITDLKSRIEALARIVSESQIRERLRSALTRITGFAGQITPNLDGEWPEAPIALSIDELTIKVLGEGRDDYLWEIGSGANWLAYHISIMAALQRFFLQVPNHPVPGLLVFDQPSQVYFPKRTARQSDDLITKLKDEDIQAVRKVFVALGVETKRAKGRLQIIVLDHADDEVWGGIEDVVLTEEWRSPSEKLVPPDWYGG